MSMSYIYEMHRALLKIQYVLPKNCYCDQIRTVMDNKEPHDLTNLYMRYEVTIFKKWLDLNSDKIVEDCLHMPQAKSLDDLIEECRKWSIEKNKKDEQSNVDKLTNP